MLGLTNEKELASVPVEFLQACTEVLDRQPQAIVSEQNCKLLDLRGTQLTPQLWE